MPDLSKPSDSPLVQSKPEVPQDNPSAARSNPHRPELDDVPPILGSWRNIYILNMVIFAVLVALFVLITRIYS